MNQLKECNAIFLHLNAYGKGYYCDPEFLGNDMNITMTFKLIEQVKTYTAPKTFQYFNYTW